MCGHQNNKQKIQQHMTLKKDLQDQTILIKQQQEQIAQISRERDAARNENKRLRGSLKVVESSSKPDASTLEMKLQNAVAVENENIVNSPSTAKDPVIL